MTPLVVQNQRLRRENRELLLTMRRGLEAALLKIEDDKRNAEVARWIAACNTRIRESNARDAESQRARQQRRD